MSGPPNPFGPSAPGPGSSFPAPGGFGQPYGGAPPPAQPNPALAIVSLISGIVSLPASCCCGFFSAPLALIAIGTGVFAMVSPTAGGKPMAIGGIVCGALALLWAIIALILVLVNPDFARQMQQLQNQ